MLNPPEPYVKRELVTELSRQLFKATVEEFAGKGILGARVASITQAAGVTDPAFYRYFPSLRDAALYVLSVHYWKPLNQKLDNFQRVTSDPVLLFEAVVRALIESSADNSNQPWVPAGLVFRIAVAHLRNPFLLPDSLLDPEYQRFLEKLAFIIQEGQSQGRFQAAIASATLARTLVNSLHGLLVEQQIAPSHFTPQAEECQMVARQLVGLKAEPEPKSGVPAGRVAFSGRKRKAGDRS
ncbi:MAG: TetR/AcrR family transcriptional regulator [Blastocatellia bacterium]|nr:TetR/AcrR family transcriptional regulator [Blastocatellia bacterium]